MKIQASMRIKAAESWSEYKKGNEEHDKEYEKTLKQRIQNLNEDIRDIQSDGDDASKEKDQLKRAKEELANLQKKLRGGSATASAERSGGPGPKQSPHSHGWDSRSGGPGPSKATPERPKYQGTSKPKGGGRS